MTRIGIIGAMEEEVVLLKEKMENTKVTRKAEMEFYSGILEGKDVIVVRSGIGKVNAALCTQIIISEFDVKTIINIGVAGGIARGLHVGDVVIARDLMYHDVDVTAFGYKKGVIPRMSSSNFSSNQELVALAKKSTEVLADTHKVYTGRIVSADKFVSCKELKSELEREFAAHCTEMEGAAIAHVATVNDVPFVVIRAISDNADDSADMAYDEFVHLAAANSSKLVMEMLKHI